MHTPILTSIRAFAHEHDDIPAFHAAYIVLTFLVAALFNVGAFAVLIGAHMALDFVKYRDIHRYSYAQSLRGVVRESLLDVTLLLIALTAAVYLHQVAAVITLSGLLLAEETIARGLLVLLPKMHVLHHMLHVFGSLQEHLRTVRDNPLTRWSMGEQLLMAGSLAAIAAIIFAPQLLHMPVESWEKVLHHQLVPWRM